jgi:hypothetical protein
MSTTKQTKPFIITAPHTAILQAVYHYQLLSNEQVVRACGYSEKSLERVQRLTKQLVDNGYLLALKQPVTKGNSPLVFTLARKGLNLLKDAGCDVRAYFRPSQEQEKSYLFLQHTLAVNDVLIAAANVQKSAPEYSLLQFTHERTLKQTPYKVQIDRDGKQETVTIIPDAYLLFAEGATGDQLPTLLEVDRNTTEQKNFRRSFRARMQFIKEAGYKKLLGTDTVTFAYVVAAGGEKRREELRAWSRKELTTPADRALAPLFLFAAPQLTSPAFFLSPLWYPPFESEPGGLFDDYA